jgi:hypothetical protein
MRIEGEWRRAPTGAFRPMVNVAVGASGVTEASTFLVDTGATRTVISLKTASKLGIDLAALPAFVVEGVGGLAECVELPVRLATARETGEPVFITGPFLAFRSGDSGSDDLLGNDVLGNFDVIVSRRRNEVLLLAGEHAYAVTGP